MNNWLTTASATATPASPVLHPATHAARPPGHARAATPSGWPTAGAGAAALGAVLALFGAWLCMVLVATAGGRKETLALANDVGRGEVLERTTQVVRWRPTPESR